MFWLAVFSLFMSGAAFARPAPEVVAYEKSGCGLGAVLFGQDPSRGVQVLASTSNESTSNQAFALSSGTSECDPISQNARSAQAFFEANRVAIQNDVARGSGERLGLFAEMLGCARGDRANAVLHREYERIFPAGGTSDAQAFSSIQRALRSDEASARECRGGRA